MVAGRRSGAIAADGEAAFRSATARVEWSGRQLAVAPASGRNRVRIRCFTVSSASVTETYKPGQVVPRDGTVECARHHDVQDHVKAGTRFAPCSHHHEHSEGCTWQYV